MALQQKLSLKLQQKMVLTPSLQQAIRLLQLTRMELLTEVNQELEQNPVLEETSLLEEPEPVPGREEPPSETAERDPLENYEDKIDVESYFQDYLETGLKYRGTAVEVPEESPDAERYLSAPESLSEHLLWQVGLGKFTAAERAVAEAVIGSLREDGYLASTVEEVAQSLENAYKRGKNHSIVIVAEGSGFRATELSKSLEDMDVGFKTRVTVLGHIQRGGTPTAYDRLVASRMGFKAVEALLAGQSGVMTGLKGRGIDLVSIADVIANKRQVNMEYYEMAKVLAR